MGTTLLQLAAGGARTAVGAVTRGAGSAAQLAVRASPYVQTAVVGAIAVGAAFAVSDAASLYSNRRGMASQFQDQQQFPNDLTGITPFYMSFLFQEYRKRAINDSPFLRSTGTLRLPIPDALKDTTSVSYGTTSFSGSTVNQAVGAGLEQAAGINSQQSRIAQIASIAGASIEGAGGGALEAISGSAGKAVQAYYGVTLNPYQTILFEKPNFKTHSFTWKLVPKDANESNTIRNIVRTFQYHMLPGVSDDIGLFFSFPSMVTVSLFPSSEFLYRFKPCVIENVTVNYSPGSTPSFYRGTGAPTAVTITVDLKEIEYFTNKDFTAEKFDDTTALGNSLLSTDNRTMLSAGTGDNNRVPGQGQGQ